MSRPPIPSSTSDGPYEVPPVSSENDGVRALLAELIAIVDDLALEIYRCSDSATGERARLDALSQRVWTEGKP